MTLKEQLSTGGCCFNLKLYSTMPVVMGNVVGKSRGLFIYSLSTVFILEKFHLRFHRKKSDFINSDFKIRELFCLKHL